MWHGSASLEIVHFGSSLTDHPMRVTCNYIISPSRTDSCLPMELLNRGQLKFLEMKRSSQFSSDTCRKWAICHCSFTHSLDWTLNELTQLLIHLSTIHGLFHSLNINSIGTQHLIRIEPQYSYNETDLHFTFGRHSLAYTLWRLDIT